MSIWEFNFPIQQHNLTSESGIFTRSIDNKTSGKGSGVQEDAVWFHHNVYCLLDLSIRQFYKKYCLVWLQ